MSAANSLFEPGGVLTSQPRVRGGVRVSFRTRKEVGSYPVDFFASGPEKTPSPQPSPQGERASKAQTSPQEERASKAQTFPQGERESKAKGSPQGERGRSNCTLPLGEGSRPESPLPLGRGLGEGGFASPEAKQSAELAITRLYDCEEQDGYRIRFPKTGTPLEGVIINTGGGVAGGDRVTHSATLAGGASVLLTTQAAERIYRSTGRPSQIGVSLNLAQGAVLAWLPQETILYNNSRLNRRFDIDMAADASLLMAEIVVFGRREMGETVAGGHYADRWRVRRGGSLAFAENIDLAGDLGAAMNRPAIANGARIIATVLFVDERAEYQLELVRKTLAKAASRIAASAWNGLLCIRCLGHDLEAVREDVSRAICALRRQPMPRVWRT